MHNVYLTRRSMPALPDLQAELSTAIFTRDHESSISGHVRTNGLSSARRIQIYRNNIYTNLTEALRAVHPVVHKLVGDGFFKYAAHEYITNHPSLSGDLHQFGKDFCDFLSSFAPAQLLPYLPDVARLEWFYHEAYHAAEHAAIDLESLAEISSDQFDQLRLHLHPSARLLHSKFPILRIWQANQDAADTGEIIDLKSGGINLLVLRPDIEIEFHTLPQGDFILLRDLAAGQTLSIAVEKAMMADPSFRLDAALGRFVQIKALVSFSIT